MGLHFSWIYNNLTSYLFNQSIIPPNDNDVIVSTMASQITSLTIVFILNHLFKVQIKWNIKAPRYWPLWGEITSDRWIPHTKGQWRWKCFHLIPVTGEFPTQRASDAENVSIWFQWPVNSPHKGPVTLKMFPFDVVIMNQNVTPEYVTFVTSKDHLKLFL